MTTPEPLRLVFDPTGDELAAARDCESQVFLETFGNTAEDFDREYGPYDGATGFVAVLDDTGRAVAATRFIGPGPAGLKTLNDVSRPPWEVDGLRSARAAGIDPDNTWEIATIAVRSGEGRGGLCAAALFHGLVAATHANEVDFVVMIMDLHARNLLTSLGMISQVLPGTGSGEYLGSADSVPLWGDVKRAMEQQRRQNPDAYRLIFQGVGFDGITMPTDWIWRRSTAS